MEYRLKSIVILSVVLVLFFSGVVWYLFYLNNIIKQKENEILIKNQNEAALNDYIKMQADSIQNFSIFVSDLQKENEKKDKQYNILKSKYAILIDSIKILNKPANNVDTSGNTIVVEFEGKEGKISYKGKTVYFKLTGDANYSISIGVDTSYVESLIYLDIENNLIKNRIYIDGALITNAKTEIDSSVYILLQNNKIDNKTTDGFFDRLRLLFDVNQRLKFNNNIWQTDKFSMSAGLEYQFNLFRIYSKYDYINSEINVGLQYHPSLRDIWKFIF